MEILGLVDLPVWLVGIVVFVMTVCMYTWYKQSFFKRLGIPQKPTVFFLGDLPEMSKKGFGYVDCEMVKKNGKVFGLYLGNTPSLIISDTDMIKQIMVKEFSKFTDRVALISLTKRWESAVSQADGEHWRFLRSTLSPTFTSGKMREINPYIHKCLKTLHELLDEKIEIHPEGFDIRSFMQVDHVVHYIQYGQAYKILTISRRSSQFTHCHMIFPSPRVFCFGSDMRDQIAVRSLLLRMIPEVAEVSRVTILRRNIGGYTLDVICSTGFGLDVDAQKNPDNAFIKYSREFLEFRGLRNPVFILQIFFPDLLSIFGRFLRTNIVSNKAFDFFFDTLTTAFKERRQEQSKHRDLLQLMVNAHKDKGSDFSINDDDLGETSFEGMKQRGLTDVEVIINSVAFMLGGYDNTATTLCWIIYDLVTNMECQEKLIEEIDAEIGDSKTTYDNVFKLKYLDMVVNETLRMHPPAQRINRKALEDVEINGVHIKKGMDCTFSVQALHYMPEYWEKPNKYDPERFAPEHQANINLYAYMPFGQGPRNCIGKRLALLEVKETVVTLLQKYKFFKTDKLKVPMTVSAVGLASCKPAEPVFVRLEKRANT